LGQLARQLDTSTEKIVRFLEKEKNTTIKFHPNAKVPDDLIDDVIQYFGKKEPIQEEETTKVKHEKVQKAEEKKEETKEEKVIEVAKKVEEISAIAQPKIIGKIDLPDKSQIEVNVDGVVYTEEELEQRKKDEREAAKAKKEQEEIEKAARKKALEEKKRKEREKRLAEEQRLKDLQDKEAKLLSAEEQKKKKERERKLKEQEALRK